MKLLHASIVLKQCARKKIKQCWICRRLAETTEVIRCRRDRRVEVMLPHTIRHRSPCESVARIRDPIRKRQASTARLTMRRLHHFHRRASRSNERHIGLHDFTERMRTSARHHLRDIGLWKFAHAQHGFAFEIRRSNHCKLRAKFVVVLRRIRAVACFNQIVRRSPRRQSVRHFKQRLFTQHAVIEAHFIDIARERAVARKHSANGNRAWLGETLSRTARAINHGAIDAELNVAARTLARECDVMPLAIVVAWS